MVGLSSPGGTDASTMPQTAPAARVKTPRLIRFKPLMSTMVGIIAMSFTPTKPRTSPLASVDTMTFGIPSGSARIAAVPIDVPAPPPIAIMASSSPRSSNRCTMTLAPRLIAVTARPRSASETSAASDAPPAVATSSRVMKGVNAGWPRTPTSTTSTLWPRSSICFARKRTSSPLVSSAPSTTTVAMFFRVVCLVSCCSVACFFVFSAALVDDRHGTHRRRRRVDPLDREDGQLESVSWQLIQVRHVFQMVILPLAHDAVRFPKLFPLEHCPHRRIERDGVDPHHLDAVIEHPVRRLGSHAALIGDVGVAVLNLPGTGVNQHDVQRLQRVVDLRQCRLRVFDRDSSTLGEMTKVQADAIPEAVVERNGLGARALLAQVAQRIHVGAHVVAKHHHVARRQRRRTVLRRADTLSKLLPGFIHDERRPDDTGEHHHVVMHGHAQIDQLTRHQESSISALMIALYLLPSTYFACKRYCVAVMPPSR